MIELTCQNCGIKFETLSCLEHTRKFCSMKCRGQSNRGEKSPNWKGGRTSRLVAEESLGKSLPVGAVVHHVNGNKVDNRPSNLVICQDTAYHFLLHVRMRALRVCGHANWRKCGYCGEYDDPLKLIQKNHHRHWRNWDKAYRRN